MSNIPNKFYTKHFLNSTIMASGIVVLFLVFLYSQVTVFAQTSCTLDVKLQETTLSAGIEYYTDRTYTFTNVPAQYIGLDMIKTPNDDRNLTAASDYLTFELLSNTTVYVAYDRRATSLPNWMSGFTDTGDTINTSLSSQQYLKVYSKNFLSGECVDLGANKAAVFSGGTVSSYVVFYGSAADTLTVSITAAEMSELGGNTTATVTRNSETSGSLVVNLSSDDTSEATVTTTVTIAAGQTTSPSFTVTAVDDALLDGTQTVTVKAIAVGYADGTDTIDVTDDEVAATLTVSITAVEMSELGGNTSATVARNSETSGSLVVNLSSDDTSEATVPTTLTIAAGQTTSPSFTVTAVDDALVDGTLTVTVKAIA
ncbi:MAG: hypothetical protein GY941_12150, partial [Planctomycetes bacterium]|nr:hypothetical protein [Planctomycetota bacterium]